MTNYKNISIKVENLTKKYHKSDKLAVNDISFSVHKGEFFTLLGPNGAGKTTTISILTTILSKSSGTVSISGLDLDKDSGVIRKKVGIIFQKPSLDQNLTAEENIRFHSILYGIYNFAPTFNSMPKSYQEKVLELSSLLEIESELSKPIKTFSGGMRRKLEIIRSLMHNPEVLFLDEPTTGLDPNSRKNLWDYLQKVRKEKQMTIFLTTHYLDEAEVADQVCIINYGKIIEKGTPRSIKDKLMHAFVRVDSNQRSKLLKELKENKLHFRENGPFIIPITKNLSAQDIIHKINVKLSELDIINPTLEQAYLEIINHPTENETRT